MKRIEISVENLVAWQTNSTDYVCGNSEFVVGFVFDKEWNEFETKTARFIHGGEHTDIVFTGTECKVPKILNVKSMEVGVFAGDLCTTTPAVVHCRKSILCKSSTPADPTPDVYAQIMEKLNSLKPNENGDTYPIKRIESLDTENTENLVNLRDLESGIYILYGYFKPFPGSDSTLIIDDGYYMVARVAAGSHLLSISPLNFRMTCHEILVDDTNEKGFTYTNTRINLLDMHNAVAELANGVKLADRTTGKNYTVYVDNGKLTMMGVE